MDDFQEPKTKFRRAKALYDCEADHSDELTFVEGEIIIMKGEADPDWWVSHQTFPHFDITKLHFN